VIGVSCPELLLKDQRPIHPPPSRGMAGEKIESCNMRKASTNPVHLERTKGHRGLAKSESPIRIAEFANIGSAGESAIWGSEYETCACLNFLRSTRPQRAEQTEKILFTNQEERKCLTSALFRAGRVQCWPPSGWTPNNGHHYCSLMLHPWPL
jgi:hypothetical protein